jgi:predicted metalloprotease with PDZ domain
VPSPSPRRIAIASFVLVTAGIVVTHTASRPAGGQPPSGAAHEVAYELSFPDPSHRSMQVSVSFRGLPSAPLELRMSRSSPGRYALHEFAKNVFDVRAHDGGGRQLWLERPSPHQWNAVGHDGTVRLTYRVFGDTLDGTYLAVDDTHAHINVPAALMWARGLETRPVRLALRPPPGQPWRAATQLFATGDPLVFTAPNLQYLMDSPIELGRFTMRTFSVPVRPGGPLTTIRIAMHHLGSDTELESFVRDTEAVVLEQRAVFGELPDFEPGHYTFLVDYVPWAQGDGMEHRNSTVITSPGSLREGGRSMLDTVAHEFFHAWNVERIRPRSLEPFDFEDANPSQDLWLAEGFTSYYGWLTMVRAGLMGDLDQQVAGLAGFVAPAMQSPARRYRSIAEMSLLAPFVDGARPVDRTDADNTYFSYYTGGAAVAAGLDLALRGRSNGRVGLDDFMRAMWTAHGRSQGLVAGVVARPYTLRDVRDQLARVAEDRAWSDDFVDRFVTGRDIADYAALLARAGLVARRASAGQAWLGPLRLTFSEQGARLASPPIIDGPAFAAGLGQDDLLVAVEGRTLVSQQALADALRGRSPGQTVTLRARTRSGRNIEPRVTLEERSLVEIVPVERTGGAPTSDQREFRQRWLSSQQ